MTYADIKVVFSGPGDVNLETDGVVDKPGLFLDCFVVFKNCRLLTSG